MLRIGTKVKGRFLGFTWNEPLGIPESPFARRWMLDFGFFSSRLHHWLSSDDSRAPHDHGESFVTIILRGGYVDHGYDMSDPHESGYIGHWREYLPAGSIRYRGLDHIHWVEIDPGRPCWSLVIAGPRRRMPGFWIRKNGRNKRMRQNKYFFTYGQHHPDPGQPPRRTRKFAEGHSEGQERHA